jgi:hypothetical protein
VFNLERLILAWPLQAGSLLAIDKTEGWPESWKAEGAGLVRQVGRFGNSMFSKAEVFQGHIPSSGIQFMPGASLTSVFQVSNGRAFNQIICLFDITGGEKLVDALRRPGRANIAIAVKSALGTDLDPAETTLATAVYFSESGEESVSNGCLRLQAESNTFRSDITYSLIVSAIAAERLILEDATLANFKPGFFGFRAYKYSGLLQNWLTVPSTDSTKLLRQVDQLRESQGLDQRHSQVRLALEQQVKATNFAGAAFVASFGMMSSAIPSFQEVTSSQSLPLLSLIRFLLVIPVIVATATWALARRT